MADDNGKRAKELMARSELLKRRANETEFRVKMDMAAGKKGSGSIVGLPSVNAKGEIVRPSYSFGKEALRDAAEDRKQAKKDSIESVKLMKPAAIVAPVKRPSEAVMKKLTGK